MKILFICSLSFCWLISIGQVANNTGELNSKNIYHQSLVKYYLTTRPDKNLSVDTFYIEEDILTDSLLLNYTGVQFIKLDKDKIKQKAMTDTNFTFLKIYPLEFNKGFFYVPIRQFWVGGNLKGLTEYTVLDYSKLEYQFKKDRFFYRRKLIFRI
jgi:hypothetical protein